MNAADNSGDEMLIEITLEQLNANDVIARDDGHWQYENGIYSFGADEAAMPEKLVCWNLDSHEITHMPVTPGDIFSVVIPD